ncbi:Ig-like domain-containing protein, partial [Piscinibacter sp.]|uniref:Ig-like domain-containing protein n=1 Tax=Piscinibacter sp. TaxID=1903157 RepID=UPI002C5ED66E
MPTILQTAQGQVTGLWGAALIRGADGKMRALKLGDIVHRGDVILTTQDGIVRLAPVPEAEAAVLPPSDDIDRVITGLNTDDPTAATAAVLAGDGGGELGPGLRVDRIVETLGASASLPGAGTRVLPQEVAFSNQIGAADRGTDEPANPTPPLSTDSTSISATEEGPAVNLGLTQPAGVPATAVITVDQVPAIGVLQMADGTVLTAGMVLSAADLPGLRYVPPADYNASDPVGSFAYTLSSGGASATGSTSIGLAAVNDAPSATAATAEGLEDSTLPISLAGTDIDGTVTAVTVTDIPAGSTLLLADGVTPVLVGQALTPAQAAGRLVRPSADFNGSTGISFTVTDDGGAVSAVATVAIAVTPVNDMPVAAPDAATTSEDNAVSGNVLANDTDVDGPALSVTQFLVGGTVFAAGITAALAGVGTLVIEANGDYTFTPAPNYNGSVPVATYTVSDGSLTSTGTLTIGITPGDDVPVAVADAFTAVEDQAFLGSVAGNDDLSGDGGNVFALVAGSGPSNGGIVFNNDGTFTYTPNANYNGADEFSYSITDADGDVSTATVTINVASVNDVPTAVADSVAATEDTPFVGSVAGNDTPSGDGGNVFALVGGSGPSNGGIVFNNDGTFTYTPNANYNGADEFSYSITDADGDVSTATVTINVASVNDAPTAVAETVAATEDTPFVGSVAGNDTPSGDGGNIFALVGGSGPSNGGIVFNNDGTFT